MGNNGIHCCQDDENDEKKDEANVEHHGLRPVEIVSTTPHGQVARVPEQVLKPPDRAIQRMLRSVQDPSLQPLHLALVGFPLQHLRQLSGQGLLREAVPVNRDTDAKANGFLGVGELVAVDRDGNGWGRVADTLLEAART